MTYGFRLFHMNLVPHHSRSPEVVPWVLPDGTHYVHHASACLDLLCGADRRLRAKPSWTTGVGNTDLPPYTAARGDKVVRWLTSQEISPRHLRATLAYGTVGSHDTALGETNNEDTPLGSRAPSNPYRVELIFGEQDEQGLLVVETQGRSCPVQSVARWLTVTSDLLGGTPTSGSERSIWKLETPAMVDREHLRRLLMKGQRVELMLKGTAPSPSGISSGNAFKVQFKIDEDEHRADLLGRFLERGNGQVPSPRDLLEVVSTDTLEGFDLTDGSITVEDETGEVKTVWLQRLDEVFTYSTGHELAPSEPDWTSAVRTKVGEVRPDLTW